MFPDRRSTTSLQRVLERSNLLHQADRFFERTRLLERTRLSTWAQEPDLPSVGIRR